MINKLGDRLKELLNDHKILDIGAFCKKHSISRSDFSRWCSNKTMPSIENAIKLANIFSCTLDYLIGKTDENSSIVFHVIPPFCERFRIIMEKENTTPFIISRNSNFGRTSLIDWVSGKKTPTLSSLMRLANYFEYTLDYLVGREQ